MSAETVGRLTFQLDMRLDPDALERAIDLLRATLSRTEAKPGCYGCWVSRVECDDGHVVYREEWVSEDVFRKQVRSEEFRSVLVAMDMCCEEPSVMVGTLTGHTGISYLRELLGEPSDEGGRGASR